MRVSTPPRFRDSRVTRGWIRATVWLPTVSYRSTRHFRRISSLGRVKEVVFNSLRLCLLGVMLNSHQGSAIITTTRRTLKWERPVVEILTRCTEETTIKTRGANSSTQLRWVSSPYFRIRMLWTKPQAFWALQEWTWQMVSTHKRSTKLCNRTHNWLLSCKPRAFKPATSTSPRPLTENLAEISPT